MSPSPEDAILPSLKGILGSYRWRRRLAWLAATALVVGSAVTTAIVWPNTAPKESAVPQPGSPNVDYTQPKQIRMTAHDKAMALAVASRFIHTAVARKHIDRSWDLTAPELRAGFTRKQWDSGTIPVVGYSFREARWALDFSDTEGVGFQIALFPTKGSQQQAQVFLIGLHRIGARKKRHWVVDNWQSAPTSGTQNVSAGPGGGGPKPTGNARESQAWLLLPAGLLSLIVLLPLSIATVNWYRTRRADRALLRS